MYKVSNDGHIVSWYVNESYKAGNCAIVISMKIALKWCPKMFSYCWSHFCQKSYSTKGYHNPWFFMIWGQNST